MAVHVQDNLKIEINSVDIAPFTTGGTLRAFGEAPTTLNFVDGSTTKAGGSSNIQWTLELALTQDYDAGALYATLYPILGTWVAFDAMPISGTPSATTPSFQGEVLVNDLSMFSGDAPNPTQFSVTYECRDVTEVII